MNPTTSGTFRVLDGTGGGERPLVDVATREPTDVETDGYGGDLGETVSSLRAGYLVDATLEWRDGTARFVDLTVRERTLFEFVDGVTGLFEAAQETWEAARRAGEAMNSQVTYDADGEPNGVVYVFADPGARDVFAEFRTGSLPLEPLLERLDALDGAAREVFVLRPAGESFVVVYLVAARESLLADTVRETYDCPREPGRNPRSESMGFEPET